MVLTLAACQTTPDQDPFYQPPNLSPTTHPGDIIRSRASIFSTDPLQDTPATGINAWQVLYRSDSATGAPITVSGTVLVPTAPWTGPGTRPVVSYAVGTRGLGDACAPSYTLATGTDYEGGLINDTLKKGWAVAVTDMEGLGTPGEHTYEVGQSQGRAVLNMVRAAERLAGTGLSQSSPVGIWGYSQGGTSAGWAAELAPTYAPELNLKGVAEGGVPADLNAVAQSLDGSLFLSLALFAAVGYDAAYPELNLHSYLNTNGLQLFAKAESVCLVSVDGFSTLLNTAGHHLSDYTTTNPLGTAAWQARLSQNKLGSRRPTVPIFQYHALLDEIVPLGQAETLHQAYCAAGVNETWEVLPLAEHAAGIIEGEADALAFLDARFAGTPVKSNC